MLKLKEEHNFAKAVRLDDAEVPTTWWDEAVCWGPPTEVHQKALTVMRDWCLQVYRRWLWKEVRHYLNTKIGNQWRTLRHDGDQGAKGEVIAIREILEWAAGNDWFKYLAG